MALNPDKARSWIAVIWPTLVQGGPALSLVLLLLGAFQVYYLLGVIATVQANNRTLVERLLEAKDTHRAELLRYVRCQAEP